MLLSCKVGGEGINLVGASRLILYDPDREPQLAAGSRTVVSVRAAGCWVSNRSLCTRRCDLPGFAPLRQQTTRARTRRHLLHRGNPSGGRALRGIVAFPIPALTCLYVSGSLSHLASPHSPDACVCRAGAQVQGRLWRPGQKAPHVYTYRLLSTGTCEELYAPQGSNCTPQIAHAFLIRGSRLIRIFGRQQAKIVRSLLSNQARALHKACACLHQDLGGGAGIGDAGFLQLSDRAALISLDSATYSSTFKPLEAQCLSTSESLGLRLEPAVADGSVSHVHVISQ